MLHSTRDQIVSVARLLSFVAMLNLCWLESAENPAVFCYRIGWHLLAPLCRDLKRAPGLRALGLEWRGGDQPSACSNSSEA